eukprot:scaffold5682_cov188-Prasinococcus_capsulatus_cf.AAC.2
MRRPTLTRKCSQASCTPGQSVSAQRERKLSRCCKGGCSEFSVILLARYSAFAAIVAVRPLGKEQASRLVGGTRAPPYKYGPRSSVAIPSGES